MTLDHHQVSRGDRPSQRPAELRQPKWWETPCSLPTKRPVVVPVEASGCDPARPCPSWRCSPSAWAWSFPRRQRRHAIRQPGTADLIGAAPGSTTAAAAVSSPMLESEGIAPAGTASPSGARPAPSTSPAKPSRTDAPLAAVPSAKPTTAPTAKPTPAPTPKPPTGTRLALGVWSGQPWDPGALQALANKIGGTPAVYLTYVGWDRTFHREDEQAIANLGAAHVVTWEPKGYTASQHRERRSRRVRPSLGPRAQPRGARPSTSARCTR